MPERRLRDECRKRFLDGLQKAYEQDKLILRDRHGQLLAAEAFAEWLETLHTCYWNLHAKPVDMGTAGLTPAAAAERTLKYLAGYASGVALKNDRLLSLDNDEVTFSYKDYRDQDKHKVTSLPALDSSTGFCCTYCQDTCGTFAIIVFCHTISAEQSYR